MAHHVERVSAVCAQIACDKSLATTPAIIKANLKSFLIGLVVEAPIASTHPTETCNQPRPTTAPLGSVHRGRHRVVAINEQRRYRLKARNECVVYIEPIPCWRHPSRRRNGKHVVGCGERVEVQTSVTIRKNKVSLLGTNCFG